MMALFEEIQRNGFAAIERAVAEQQQENVGLDFKEKADANHGRLTREDRQTLAENLSAFANSAGGLLIFGVVARKDADGVDAAADIRQIRELSRFQAEVTHASGELLLPRHDGIQILAVPDPRVPDTGCLAIWVERSERRPHQSQAAKDRRYYKRAGDSTFIMEHYDIEDALRRLTTPDLQLETRMESGSSMGGPFGHLQAYNLVFSLRNDAPITARFPYLHFLGLAGLHLDRSVARHSPLRFREQAGQFCFDGGADAIIHPEQTLVIASIEMAVITEGARKSFVTTGRNGRAEDMTRVSLSEATAGYQCAFGAENCRMRRVVRKYDSAEIQDMLRI